MGMLQDPQTERLTVAIVGPFGPAQLTCMRSWKRLGLRVVFVHLTNEDLDAWFIHHLADGYLRLTHSDFLDESEGSALCCYLATQRVTGVTALSYSSIARLHSLVRNPAWPKKARVWASREQSLHFLESKQEQIELARKCGIDVAPTAYLSTLTDALNVDFDFPWAIRPDSPDAVTPSFKVAAINSLIEWEDFFSKIQSLRQPIIAQPLIDGINIVVHGARSESTGQVIQSAFEVPRMLDGVSLNLRASSLPEYLADACKKFVDEAAVVGVYHFDLRRSTHNGRFYFLEINGRLGGTTGKVYRLDYDEPRLLVEAFAGKMLQQPALRVDVLASNRQAIMRATKLSLGNQLSVFDYPSQNKLKRMAKLLFGGITWRDEILFWPSMRSGFIFLLDSVRRRLARPESERHIP